jgi:hypothetical protein
MTFEIIGGITRIETIARGRMIHDLARLRKQYGEGRWRKQKRTATNRLADGTVCVAEIHWYEAHGVGAEEHKIKALL